MAVLNITAVAEALKEYYLPGLRYQLNDQASVFLTQLERDSESVIGKEIVMYLRYGRVGGIGNRADDGDLPTPNSRKGKQAKWETKNLFSRFQISDKTIEASRSNMGAFVQALDQEIADCETDAKLDLSRQALGDGTGALCTVTAYTEGAAVTVSDTTYLCEGMLIDIYTTTTKDTSAAEIIAVDEATNVITLSATPTTAPAANDVIYVAGNKGLELTGLKAVFEANTLYGIARADYPFLKATRTNVGGEIADVNIQKAIDESERKAGAKINFLMGSYGVRRAYLNLMSVTKQTVNSLDLKGGFSALSYNNIPFVADKYIPAGKLHCLDLGDWKLYQMGDYSWLDRDGAMLTRVSGKPVWEATLVKYCDIGCQRPRAQVELYGITEH
jgi:hypothetical protein